MSGERARPPNRKKIQKKLKKETSAEENPWMRVITHSDSVSAITLVPRAVAATVFSRSLSPLNPPRANGKREKKQSKQT